MPCRLSGLAISPWFVCLTGYSGGQQLNWLEKTLREASTDTSIDWIVAVMHQPAMSTSDADGSDLGIRQNWMPLFYKYGVDFVLAGHDHDYERSYLVRGTDSGTVLRPHVVSTNDRGSRSPRRSASGGGLPPCEALEAGEVLEDVTEVPRRLGHAGAGAGALGARAAAVVALQRPE